MKYKKVSIIIPVYNEERFIQNTIRKVLHADTLGLTKEIIIVDDGSTDDTLKKIKSSLKKISKNNQVIIKKLFKKTNQGKGAALRIGFKMSTGDIVIVQDADLEYNPDDYPRLLEPYLKCDADVVFGSRFISDRPHRVLYFWHSVGNFFLIILSNIFTNLNLTDLETGYKTFKGELIRSLASKLQCSDFGFEPEIVARIAKLPNLKIYEVGVSYWGRTYKQGKKINWFDGVKAIYYIIKFNLFSGPNPKAYTR